MRTLNMATGARYSAPVRNARAIAAILALASLSACTGATPYQSLGASKAVSGGYSDQQIDSNRYSVRFSGNDMTSRQIVETYLLYRAAQLTRQKGYDWFTVADRDVDKQTTTSVDPSFANYGFWAPAWRFYGSGFGWRSWDPAFGGPFGGFGFDVNTVDRYEASAEILMFRGERPANDAASYDAEEVLTNLQSQIVQPK